MSERHYDIYHYNAALWHAARCRAASCHAAFHHPTVWICGSPENFIKILSFHQKLFSLFWRTGISIYKGAKVFCTCFLILFTSLCSLCSLHFWRKKYKYSLEVSKDSNGTLTTNVFYSYQKVIATDDEKNKLTSLSIQSFILLMLY